jgi:hypothetical protein
MLVRIPDNPDYAFQAGNFLRSPLRVAPGDKNSCLWILAMHPSNRCTRILIRRGSDSTGIQDNQVRVGKGVCAAQSLGGKLLLDRCAVSLRGTTTKILHKKVGHNSDYSNPRKTNFTAKDAKVAKKNRDKNMTAETAENAELAREFR